jgi:hypothetical protein
MYRDQGRALFPQALRKFYFREQIGPSCEKARSAGSYRADFIIDKPSFVIQYNLPLTLSSSSSAGIK